MKTAKKLHQPKKSCQLAKKNVAPEKQSHTMQQYKGASQVRKCLPNGLPSPVMVYVCIYGTNMALNKRNIKLI